MEKTAKQTAKEKGDVKISILDLKAQYAPMRSEIEEAIKRVAENQDFILGEEVRALEREVAAYCGAAFGVGLASGTDALILAMKGFGIGAGDEVITVPFTFFATAEAISLVGAKPVFVDIDPKTYTIDPDAIEAKITKATKAIIPVHLYGQCADMDPIMKIARRHNLKVIEDACQAIGATYKGRKAGSLGDIAAFSFFPSKNLGGFGDGGMITTSDKALADRIKVLRVHGSSERYIHSMVGYNSRLDNLQAAVLRIKLKYLDGWLEARRRIAETYNEKLKGLDIVTPQVPSHNVHTYHLYVLRIKKGLDQMTQRLTEAGIEARTYYPIPLHLQECYKDLGYRPGSIPESESAAKETFSIPVYPELTAEQIERVAGQIRSFFGR